MFLLCHQWKWSDIYAQAVYINSGESSCSGGILWTSSDVLSASQDSGQQWFGDGVGCLLLLEVWTYREKKKSKFSKFLCSIQLHLYSFCCNQDCLSGLYRDPEPGRRSVRNPGSGRNPEQDHIQQGSITLSPPDCLFNRQEPCYGLSSHLVFFLQWPSCSLHWYSPHKRRTV